MDGERYTPSNEVEKAKHKEERPGQDFQQVDRNTLSGLGGFKAIGIMGNKPVIEEREEYLVRAAPRLDKIYVRWLTRDLERIHGYEPKNTPAIKPPDHYIEYMRFSGWLDLDLNDPDLAHLFK